MANQTNSFDPHVHPYFLHSNENPAVVLVTPLLNEKNCQSWSRSMKLVLESKNKLDFITKGIPQPPPNDPLNGSWK
ncbi:hypothetical protein TanjilG_03871 [Lupinus angustifolius]|uniref:Retrotransposon Copia-like N-terminal domain-containing protein n=1 Tax=Lupinus angustifolius TaxID=3871 RepID=A0A4P1R4M9_LUPAN|nr:hypothetical protein TanjilG_03871 [Lupinus angustifolius]